MSNVKLRKFKESDKKEILELIQRNLKEVNSKYYSKKIIEILFKGYSNLKTTRNIYRLVMEKNKKIIGTGMLNKNLIKEVFILPEYHRRGFGRIIMNELENIAKKKKIKKVRLSASRNALKFYEGVGYKKLDNTKNKMIGSLMEKKL